LPGPGQRDLPLFAEWPRLDVIDDLEAPMPLSAAAAQEGASVGGCQRSRSLVPTSAFVFVGAPVGRMPRLLFIVDLELLGRLGVLIGLTLLSLILTGMFIVAVVVVILRATCRVLGKDRLLQGIRDG